MRSREVRDLSTAELTTKIDELHEAMRNLRFQRAVGQLKDPTRFRVLRHDIARMKTILRERELAAAAQSKES